MRFAFFALAALALAAPITAPAAPAAPVAVNTKEQADLAARKVVIRMDDGTGAGTSSGVTTGIIDVQASVDETIDAVFDLKARVAEVSGLKSVDYYLEAPPHLGAHWEMSVFGKEVVYNLLYEMDRPEGWATFSLDTSKPNDVERIDGTYHIYRVDGATRLVYTSSSDPGTYVPGFIKNWLANDALGQVLEGIRARAEKAK